MVHPEHIPSEIPEGKSLSTENVMGGRGLQTSINGPPEHSSANSSKAPTSIVQKAKAVLNDELKSRPSPSRENIGNPLQGVSSELESTITKAFNDVSHGGMTSMEELRNQKNEQSANRGKSYQGDQPLGFSILKSLLPICPGETCRIPFSLINDDPNEWAQFTLNTTDLIGLSGHRIPGTHITMSQNSGTLKPGETVDGHLEIHVPMDTPQDSFAGLLQMEDSNQPQAVIHFSVSK